MVGCHELRPRRNRHRLLAATHSRCGYSAGVRVSKIHFAFTFVGTYENWERLFQRLNNSVLVGQSCFEELKEIGLIEVKDADGQGSVRISAVELRDPNDG